MTPAVVSVSESAGRGVSKAVASEIWLVEAMGVRNDVHLGASIRHLARMQRDPAQPNLRQVHLLQSELHDELAARGLPVSPGQMGENVTTRGIDLLALPTGTVLGIGEAMVKVTGLRNPCHQLDGIHEGLMAATLSRDVDGGLIRRCGVMGVVLRGGRVRAGDRLDVELPDGIHRPLVPV